MKEILDKITSYNLFNYLLPGVIFVAILSKFTIYSFTQDNLIIGAFIYYFVGVIISRFGSLVIEPILRKISFLKFTQYEDFVSASKESSHIEKFSETSSMYRNFVSMFILILILKAYELLSFKLSLLNNFSSFILIIILFILFLFSYKKQTKYITKRINHHKA
jgi:hypothetical protein